ncbi:MAG: MBL fold metallo-hydrolase [Oscillospiraceae bacterium]|nr:MBL fold metallo-hydrolase [Oscillospiraceae bacterium]
MNNIYPLFSSSKGNSVYIGNPESGILIDVGVSYKRLCSAMNKCGLDISAVCAVFITHEHSDHVKGLSVLTKKHKLTLYGQGITLRHLIDSSLINEQTIINEINSPVSILDMTVQSFDTPHDTEQSCGYRIDFKDKKSCAVCTDLGYVTHTVDEHLLGADTVLIEANYDNNMLIYGPYPPYVKQRIKSEHGHLSNDDSAKQILRLIEHGTTKIILGHLSQENNSPELAEQTVRDTLERGNISDYILHVASAETDGTMVVI